MLSNLISKNLLTSTGSSRGMKYIINYENDHISYFNIGGNDQKINKITLITAQKKRIAPATMLEYIIELCSINSLSAKELAHYLNRDDEWIKKKYISKLVKEGRIKLLYPDKPKHLDQKYYI